MFKLFMLAAAMSVIFGIIVISADALLKIWNDIKENDPEEETV